MVWSGTDWYVLVGSGMGFVRSGTWWYGVIRDDTVYYGVVRCGTGLHGMVRGSRG